MSHEPFTDDLLDRLVGEWELTGNMMDRIPLRQRVTVDWVLNHQFLRMHTIQTDKPQNDRPRYESLTYIGWNVDQHRYVMTLLDVFGGRFAETVGLGTPDDETSITFEFAYPDGPLHNTVTWLDDDRWQMLLSHRNDGDVWDVFAEKHLTRIK